MVVDSSALAEQVVADIIASGFDSAGQRCSALRILLLQEEIAEHLLIDMLRGAMRELRVGRTDRLDTDVGPVITAEARDGILRHIEAMRDRGFPVFQAELSADCADGTFVPPTLIEIPDPSVLGREVFGPVVHVVRYRRSELDAMIERVNALGYGLTFGIHSRVDETIAQRHRADRGRQHLRQPQHHRRGGRRAAVRRARAVGHRAEGGRAAVSAAVPGGAAGGERPAAGRRRRSRSALSSRLLGAEEAAGLVAFG